jgi:hypothetical protein
MQRAENVASHHSDFGCPRFVQRLFTANYRKGIQRLLRRLGLIERPANDLDRRQRLPANESRSLARGKSRGAAAHGSSGDDGEGPHRRARAAFELQRRAEELELALTKKFLEIDQPFPVRNAQISAEAMLSEDVVGRLVG